MSPVVLPRTIFLFCKFLHSSWLRRDGSTVSPFAAYNLSLSKDPLNDREDLVATLLRYVIVIANGSEAVLGLL